MKKRIFAVILVFIIVFILLGKFSFSAVNNYTYWQLENHLKSNINYLNTLTQSQEELKKNYEKMAATGIFDSIYIVNKDEFVGKIDINLKNNIREIDNKKKLYINNKLYILTNINDNKIVVSKEIPENYWSNMLINNLLIYYSIIFLFSLIFIYITYLLIINPINKLKRNTQEISNGQFHLDIDIEGSKEVNELVDNFKKMKDRILRDIDLLKFVINNMKLGFILFNNKGEITLINDEARKELNISKNNDINILDLFSFITSESKRKNQLFSAYKIATINGEPFFADIVYTSFKWKENYENVIIFKKINSIVKNEDKKLKSSIEYISSTLAHEIKNPLNVISMILQTLRKKYNESEMWNDIEEEIHKINYIINNLLNLIKYDNEFFNLKEFLENIIAKWRKLFNNKNIIFEYNIEKNVKLLFDKDKLNIILSNIFKNCYENLSENDKIIFEEYIDSEKVILEIKDFGKGLNKNEMLRILEKGYSKKDEDSGWGLFIVKFLMQMHGADFEIESEQNNYTKVRLIFKYYENINS
ncbi:MAG: HAMP domain-containing protein [Candidatus Mcinerneyibacterium aminivorans]|uniref:histidine kinase n=1 Tax=Candidatus Mcinerneyibacterium aminivorans TaxID=2703815 RepID=A0A5D0MIP7_9BACT|nr:MAG: HAMP domain-containing protein [Candidatus Mcinerneyibacterium aminivorans]